ncbi:MAG TPA: cytochrome c [Gemmatimonadales bacterium]|nr:cytochrome c [Gemmatimonadales bacterium]
MPRRERRAGFTLALAVASIAATGCDWYYNKLPSPDDVMHAIPWFDHMIYQKSVTPYGRADVPRYTVPGTVPINGGEPDWGAEWAGGKTTTADTLTNPTKPGAPAPTPPPYNPSVPQIPADFAARGDTLFHTYCSVCHGQGGAGDGLVGRKIGAPSLLTAHARGLSDGYIYSMIRYGRGLMPRYGDKIYDPHDRWAIVDHVRALQAAAPAPPAPASPAPRGPR